MIGQYLSNKNKSATVSKSKKFLDLNKAYESILTKALFSSPQKPKTFQNFPSHRILWHMHRALNVDKNKN